MIVQTKNSALKIDILKVLASHRGSKEEKKKACGKAAGTSDPVWSVSLKTTYFGHVPLSQSESSFAKEDLGKP